MLIHVDIESRSTADLSSVGTWNYSLDSTTSVLCICYAVDDSPVKRVVPKTADTLVGDEPELLEFFECVANPSARYAAHNMTFEYIMLTNIYKDRLPKRFFDLDNWECTLAQASSHGLPRKLERLALALDLPEKKDMSGHSSMMALSRPRKPTKKIPDTWNTRARYPEKYATLYNYCEQDVEVERACYDTVPAMTERAKEIWRATIVCNLRGVQTDQYTVQKLRPVIDRAKDIFDRRIQFITAGSVKGISENASLARFLQEQNDHIEEPPAVDKTNINLLLRDKELNEASREALEVRAAAAKSSLAKFTALSNLTDDQGVLRDTLLYHGAHTGRWAGMGVQLQNLPASPGFSYSDMESMLERIHHNTATGLFEEETDLLMNLSLCVRGMLTVRNPDNYLLQVDYSNIEARILLWLAGQEDGLEVLRTGGDLYKDMAAHIYSVPVEEVTGEQRALGKQAVLGCGYGMGVARFRESCAARGLDISEKLASSAVQGYRTKYHKVKELWEYAEGAAVQAVKNPGQAYKVPSCEIRYMYREGFLWCKLPSKRMIAYYKPKIELVLKWGSYREELQYQSLATGGQVFEASTYGGKLTENFTQGVAADFMADSFLKLHKDPRFDILFTVHDEAVSEVSDPDLLEEKIRIMCDTPDWAKGCPIEAEGEVRKRFHK